MIQHALGNGATLIDDSYNANPGSLNAAIDLLSTSTRAEGQGDAWLVLGDMRELGADAQALHAEAGRRARAAGIARLYALGEFSAQAAQAFGEGARTFDSHAALADALRRDLAAFVGATSVASSSPAEQGLATHVAPTGIAAPMILVKGSRGSAMDRVVRQLLEQEAAHAA
jgi:UDP-N-acetylmuramoyl-tripeptide--D-alanyl-D-alanine ligase